MGQLRRVEAVMDPSRLPVPLTRLTRTLPAPAWPAAAGDPLTVVLVAKAAADLQITQERSRLSRTDIVNRALSLYEFVDVELQAGAELILRRDGVGSTWSS